MSKCCKTCRHMVVHPNAAGQRRVLKNKAYWCRVTIPELPLPDCVTKSPVFIKKMPRSYIRADDGSNCPLWEALA